jgi:uncharacterized protein (DUF1697 family)
MAGYVALLRGINVGGKNPVRMVDLRACVESAGFTDVVTYIQSGNVVFAAPTGRKGAALEQALEALLSQRFGFPLSVVVRSRAQMRAVVAAAPDGFGGDLHRCDVIFLKPPLRPAAAARHVRTRPGVDEVLVGPGVLYFSRLVSRITQSMMSSIVASPIYANVTIRNWRTTTRLLELVEQLP